MYALVTGASKGIGRALAAELAARGFDLLLVARSADLLRQVAADLTTRYGRRVAVLAQDLLAPDAPARVAAWAAAEATGQLGVLVNNAGFGLWGSFADLSLPDQQRMLRLNAEVPMSLTHALLSQLLQQPRGYILNVASTAAYQAVPTLAVYGATKAFVVSWSRALRYELRRTGVSVTTFSPGSTESEFMAVAGMQALAARAAKFMMPAEAVARAGVTAMLAGRSEVIPGFSNQLGAFLTRLVPKALTERIAARLYE